MPRFIVTANYRDRSSKFRYLIRRENEPIANARACKRVECIDVRFTDSTDEEGFGCYIVASCGEAVGSEFEDEQPAVTPGNLRFTGRRFEANGERIDAVDSLALFEDGRMLAEFSQQEELATAGV